MPPLALACHCHHPQSPARPCLTRHARTPSCTLLTCMARPTLRALRTHPTLADNDDNDDMTIVTAQSTRCRRDHSPDVHRRHHAPSRCRWSTCPCMVHVLSLALALTLPAHTTMRTVCHNHQVLSGCCALSLHPLTRLPALLHPRPPDMHMCVAIALALAL